MKYRFCCVGARGKNLKALNYLMDNERQVTMETFRRNVNRNQRVLLESALGYNRKLPISRDYHVSYHKGKLPNGKPAYFLKHSAIEHVFHD